MANKKRLGTDAFDWLRDTRGDQDSEGSSEEQSLQPKTSQDNQGDSDGESGSAGGLGQGSAGSGGSVGDTGALKKRKSRGGQRGQRGQRVRGTAKTSKDGLPENWTRATFIMREDLLEKFKDIAYWDRKAVKELFNEMLEKYVLHRQRKNGEIKSRPKDKG